MRSGTSYFDRTVFKKTVARFWPLWTAYLVLWLILLPLNGLMMLRLDAQDKLANYLRSSGYMENFAQHTVPSQTEAALFLALIAGVLCAMAVFSHLYSARSANLFGSLPVRREGLFATHYLAGLSFMIVPNAVVFLLTLLVELAGGAVCWQGLLFWLGAACGECLFFYSLAVFCAMFTGHILALPAFYGIVNIFAYGVTGLLHVVMSGFYYGFAGFSPWVSDVVKWLTPVQALEQNVGCRWVYPSSPMPDGGAAICAETSFDGGERVLRLYGLGTVGIYALAGLALAACAFLLYRARRLESAGDVVSVQPMRPVFKYGVAICAGMAFGVGTTGIIGGGEFTLMAAILVWGVAGCFAAQMLLDKSFRVFKKWKGAAAVAGVFVLLFLVVGFDLTGYETRIPGAADVESVEVSGLSGVFYYDDGDSVYLDVTDPEQIGLLVDLHRAAVGQRDWTPPAGVGRGTSVRLEYALKNGSTLKRSYSVSLYPGEADQEGTAAWAVQRLYRSTGFYWRVYEFDLLEDAIQQGYRVDRAELEYYDDERGYQTQVAGYGGDARTLLDAVEADFRAGRIGVRTITEESISSGKDRDCLIFYAVDPANSMKWRRVRIALDQGATDTLAEMERLAEKTDNGAVREKLQAWLK